jgi:hypothetical protein
MENVHSRNVNVRFRLWLDNSGHRPEYVLALLAGVWRRKVLTSVQKHGKMQKEEMRQTLLTNWFMLVPPMTVILMNQVVCELLKGKVIPLRSIEAHLGDMRYSSYSFLTLALEGGDQSASHPSRALPPGGKSPRYPLYKRLGGPQSQSGCRGWRKNPLPLSGIEPQPFSP